MRGLCVTDWYTIRRYDSYYSVENKKTNRRVKIFGQNKSKIKISTYIHLVKEYGKNAKIGKRYLQRN